MTLQPIEPPEPAALTAEEAAEARRLMAEQRCQHCGGAHVRACPRVRRMAWHTNGTLAEVEFWPHDRWSDEHVLWPEQAAVQDETTH